MSQYSRAIVLREKRILFLPIPKSGCTSVKWQLAQVAGIPTKRFRGQRDWEVTRALSIHDLSLWPAANVWSELADSEKERVMASEDWLRLTVVRDPAARVWSAWQSKLLLQEPRFVAQFGDEDWFPGTPHSTGDLIEAFHAFVYALDLPAEQRPQNPHWAPQHELLEGFEPTYVGRAEAPRETLRRIHEHLGADDTEFVATPRENTSLLPYSSHVYDAGTATIVNRHFAEDYARFGYQPVDPGSATPEGLTQWKSIAAHRLPVVEQLVERHARIGELSRMLERTTRQAEGAKSRAAQLRGRVDELRVRLDRSRQRADRLQSRLDEIRERRAARRAQREAEGATEQQ